MNTAELLLSCLTQEGEISWAVLRSRIAVLVGTTAAEEFGRRSQSLRRSLAELGHADFFVESSTGNTTQQCRARPAMLMQPGKHSGRAMLIGARDDALIDTIERECKKLGGRLERAASGDDADTPESIIVHGKEELITYIAEGADIPLVRSAPDYWLEGFPAISEQERRSHSANFEWQHAAQVKVFDHRRGIWEAASGPSEIHATAGTVVEQILHGTRRRAVYVRDHFVSFDYKSALYVGAHLHGTQPINYDGQSQELRVTASYPMPLPCARAAVSCSGHLPNFGFAGNGAQATLIYGGVSPRTGAVLTTLLQNALPA